MKKSYLFMMVLMFVFSLAACGNNTNEKSAIKPEMPDLRCFPDIELYLI